MARQVSHPNVCRVYDIGEADGKHFLTMEYVDGEDLASLLRRIGGLPHNKAVQIARQICAGLAAAHDKGVLHRDIKPHNIMIDGRGQARITDFGLAGLADAFQGEDARSGTPAYMAPEQQAGKDVTIRSDLFALGLVLYELFTGNPVAEGRKLAERSVTDTETTGTLTTTTTEHLDPAVERIILRCLQTDPARRPASALDVAAALPGGDPLAAALAAGETPSPEMVAGGGETGSISMRTGLILLAAFLSTVALTAVLATYGPGAELRAQAKAPIILAADCNDLIRRSGYDDPKADSAYGFAGAQGVEQSFWYRQSPNPLLPNERLGVVTPTDPAPNEPGMVSIALSTSGQLRRFMAVVTQGSSDDPSLDEADSMEVFGPLFDAAGVDVRTIEPIRPHGIPPVGSDRRFAWATKDGDVRFEAASVGGKPVYFQRFSGNEIVSGPTITERGWVEKLVEAAVPFVWISVVVGCIPFARHNLRNGRGDRRGAVRLAMAVGSLTLMARLLVAEHWGQGRDIALTLLRILAVCLFSGAFALTLYLAVEPYVRRAWPERIISWTRLVAGRFGDPLVGRDLLIGLLIGMTTRLLYVIPVVLITWLRPDVPFPQFESAAQINAALSSRHTLSMILDASGGSISRALWMLFLLVALLAIFRRPRLASAGFIVTTFVFVSGFAVGGHWLPIVSIVAIYTASTALATLQFGLLTLGAATVVHTIGDAFAPTFDFSVWDAGNVGFANGVLIALAVYGFFTATRGQSLLKDEVFET